MATLWGYSQTRVPVGTYEFRVREKPGLRLYNFLFDRRNWLLLRLAGGA